MIIKINQVTIDQHNQFPEKVLHISYHDSICQQGHDSLFFENSAGLPVRDDQVVKLLQVAPHRVRVVTYHRSSKVLQGVFLYLVSILLKKKQFYLCLYWGVTGANPIFLHLGTNLHTYLRAQKQFSNTKFCLSKHLCQQFLQYYILK